MWDDLNGDPTGEDNKWWVFSTDDNPEEDDNLEEIIKRYTVPVFKDGPELVIHL